MNDPDLTRREREAFAGLPREETPPPLLEDATVAALRRRGLLGRATAAPHRRGPALAGRGLAAAAAVVCAAVVGAFALGQDLGARQTRAALLAAYERQEAAATDVERAGDAYLAALSDLVQASSRTTADPRTDAGRRAALTSLYRAADQMVRLAPDDPLSVRILQAFEQTGPAPADAGAGAEDQIIWF